MTRALILENFNSMKKKKDKDGLRLTFHPWKLLRSIYIEWGGVNGFTVSNIISEEV
jgi:hypothetical protein